MKLDDKAKMTIHGAMAYVNGVKAIVEKNPNMSFDDLWATLATEYQAELNKHCGADFALREHNLMLMIIGLAYVAAQPGDQTNLN